MKSFGGRTIDVSGLKILVVGLGVTGRACADVLPGLGAILTVTDAREDLSGLEDLIAYVKSRGAKFAERKSAEKMDCDILVLSPGLAPSDERLSTLVSTAGGWISEVELGYLISRGRIFSVTGTNGKSTVVSLAGEVLSKKFSDVRVSGNIGDAFITAASGSTDETVHVVELSSYQLEGCRIFRPDIGVVLNVREDHKTRHPSLKEYADAKARMLRSMESEDLAVLYRDDELVMAMAKNTRAEVSCFSTERELEEGAFIKGDSLVVRSCGKDQVLCRMEEMPLRGTHNAQNVLAVTLGAMRMGVKLENIRESVFDYRGLRHRIETAAFVRGVECINDSKATNVDSALAALNTFKGREVTIILGGDDKGFEYSSLYKEIKKSGAKVIVMGPGLKRIAKEIHEFDVEIEVHRAANMKEAVEQGLEFTPSGGVLLLSPSSSSFDLYRNFEERGQDFENETKGKATGS